MVQDKQGLSTYFWYNEEKKYIILIWFTFCIMYQNTCGVMRYYFRLQIQHQLNIEESEVWADYSSFD